MKKPSKSFFKRGMKYLLIAALFSAAALLFFPITVSKQVDCIEIKIDDPSYSQKSVLEISGKYHFGLFGDSYFDGRITASTFPDTSNGHVKVTISKEGAPMYYKRIDRSTDEFSLGSLVSNEFFSDFAILVYSGNAPFESASWKSFGDWGAWDTTTGYCIVSNCNDYESAIQALQSLGVLPSD